MLLLAAALVAVSIRLAYALSEEKTGDDTEQVSASDAEAALNCIMTRASVRSYTKEAVADSIIEKILKAGMAAPTAANRQPWEFVVINDQALKDSITDDFQWTKMVKGSAFSIVVCGNMNKAFDGDTPVRGNWVLDCSAASENMLLAAHALGLGGVWCGIYPEEDRVKTLRDILSLPDSLQPLNVIAFGYPEEKPVPKDKWNPAAVHYNSF